MHHDFTKFNPLKPRLLEAVDRMLAEDISHLMAIIPQESVQKSVEPTIKGGAFVGVTDQVSPFGFMKGEGIDAGAGEPEWIVNKDRYKSDTIFDSLNPIDGKITGAGTMMCAIPFFIQIITILFIFFLEQRPSLKWFAQNYRTRHLGKFGSWLMLTKMACSIRTSSLWPCI